MERQAVFLKEDVQKLLRNKFIVILGDSVQRTIYKDLTVLLQENRFLSDQELRKKGELSFSRDELLEGGRKGGLNNGTYYREVRQYRTDYHLMRFYFLTRVYGKYVETVLSDLMEAPHPDVIIMNSCLWDITRYGHTSIPKYKTNLVKLFQRFKEVLPPQTMVLWNTTMPVSSSVKGGFMVPEVAFMNETLRLDILEANYYARETVASFGYDVLDLHYYFRWQIHRRAMDGIHWNERAHRRITNLVLSHLANAWGLGVPRLITVDPPAERDARRSSRHVRSQSESQLDLRSFSNARTGARGNRGKDYMYCAQAFLQYAQSCSPSLQYGNHSRTAEERYGGPIRHGALSTGSALYMSPHVAAQRPLSASGYNASQLPYLDFSQAFVPVQELPSALMLPPQTTPTRYGKVASRVTRPQPSRDRYNPYGGLGSGRSMRDRVAREREQEIRNQ